MLKNNLFNIISENCIDSKLEYLITINAGHPIYKGHFPGIPVTPGVVEHEIVQELFEHHIGFKTKLLKISNLLNCQMSFQCHLHFHGSPQT